MKDYLKLAKKILLNTFYSIIICLFIVFIFAGGGIGFKITAQIAVLLIQGAMIYRICWKQGSSDNNFVSMNMQKPNPMKGLKAALFSCIPLFTVYLLLLLSKTGLISNDIFGNIMLLSYSVIDVAFNPIVNSVLLGFNGNLTVIPLLSIIITSLTTAFIPLVAHFSYLLGYRQYSIMEHIIYKNINKKS